MKSFKIFETSLLPDERKMITKSKNIMCNNKKSYHFNVTQVEDGKINEVMNFNFGGHHDLAELVKKTEATGMLNDKHSKELVLGVRFLHHVMKKNPENELFQSFLPAFEEFKKALKAKVNNC